MSNELITVLKGQGMSNRAIAKELGISEITVRRYLKKLIKQSIVTQVLQATTIGNTAYLICVTNEVLQQLIQEVEDNE